MEIAPAEETVQAPNVENRLRSIKSVEGGAFRRGDAVIREAEHVEIPHDVRKHWWKANLKKDLF